MNKKTLVIKIVEFIHKANIQYKELNNNDIWLLVLITFMSIFGMASTIITIFLFMGLRSIYIFNILERLGVIDDEEKNKKDDDQTFEDVG
jgi:hypothetical protein